MRSVIAKLLTNLKSDLIRLSILGLLTGIFSAIIIVAFRYFVESTQSFILPGGDPENYEALPYWAIFLLPLAGGILIGAIFHFLPENKRRVGVVHTLEHMEHHQGRLPIINTVAQFIGASISIIAGHSVGREGPSIHLGASSGSIVATLFNSNHKVTRTLLACGVSAAIAASFNTPIAGVIFAVEVILLEYTVSSMMPIIISASVATLISQSVFGAESALNAPALGIVSHSELIGIILNGIIIGLIAVIFIRLLVFVTNKSKPYPIFWRLTAAGAFTGVLALAAPQIMSIGYDTVTATFQTEIALGLVLLILVLKLIATTVGLGLGLPGGLIGPTLVIGALTGSAVGTVAQIYFPDSVSNPGIYAMIGMGAMMGATLQAPLAALMAIFELTLNPNLILPGLLAIVAASLTSSEFLRQPSVFFSLMRGKEFDEGNAETEDKSSENLTKAFKQTYAIITQDTLGSELSDKLNSNPDWLLTVQNNGLISVIPKQSVDNQQFAPDAVIDFTQIPGSHQTFKVFPESTKPGEIKQYFDEHPNDLLVIEKDNTTAQDRVLGILTREDMANYDNKDTDA